MKKLFCTLLAALLLTSCTEKIPPQDYYNTEEGCLLGNTHYQHMTAMDIQLWNPAWDSPMEGLCRDPLCSHDSTDSLCPSSTNLWLKTVVTDGEKLYMYRPAKSGNIIAKIECRTKPQMATVRCAQKSDDVVVSGGRGAVECLDKLKDFDFIYIDRQIKKRTYNQYKNDFDFRTEKYVDYEITFSNRLQPFR